MGLLDLARSEPDAQRTRHYLERAHGSASLLKSAVNDILDVARLESSKLELESHPFDLSVCLDGLVSTFEYSAIRKGLQLRLKKHLLPVFVTGDVNRLRQILSNLISNAIKFTPTGFVEVDCDVQTKDGFASVCITVTDSGIGIPAERLGAIFDPFTQVDASISRTYGGTGLGLAIARRLTQLMNGDISVSSEAGQGSTFEVKLILPVSGAPAPESNQQSPISPGTRVLVVDDDDLNRLVLERMCEKMGVQSRCVPDGPGALQLLEKERFDIVFMDCHMPGMSGDAATRKLRESGYRGVILGLTADADRGLREKCIGAGMDALITKPISMQELHQLIATLC
jgi:CheY-like chemotaxis protein/two-component sensor histidine kinase